MTTTTDRFDSMLAPFVEALKHDVPPNLDLRDQVLTRYAIAVTKGDREQALSARREAAGVGLTESELAHVRAIVLKFEIDRLERFEATQSCCG